MNLTEGVFVNNASAYIPFSFSPANCVGKNMALPQIRAIVSFIVQKFGLSIKDGFELEKWEDGIEDWFIMILLSLPVILHARL